MRVQRRSMVLSAFRTRPYGCVRFRLQDGPARGKRLSTTRFRVDPSNLAYTGKNDRERTLRGSARQLIRHDALAPTSVIASFSIDSIRVQNRRPLTRPGQCDCRSKLADQFRSRLNDGTVIISFIAERVKPEHK